MLQRRHPACGATVLAGVPIEMFQAFAQMCHLAREHSQIKIDLQEHLSADVVQAVHEGTADLGICNPDAVQGAAEMELQSRPYRSDHLMLVVPLSHALAKRDAISFEEALEWDIVGLQSGSSISQAMRTASNSLRRPLRQRIQVTSLDAMCRMIDNGLGVGLVPDRAFTLMHGVGNLRGIQLTDDWAHRELRLMARDFDALPVTARLLVEHLSPKPVADALASNDEAIATIRPLRSSIGLGAL